MRSTIKRLHPTPLQTDYVHSMITEPTYSKEINVTTASAFDPLVNRHAKHGVLCNAPTFLADLIRCTSSPRDFRKFEFGASFVLHLNVRVRHSASLNLIGLCSTIPRKMRSPFLSPRSCASILGLEVSMQTAKIAGKEIDCRFKNCRPSKCSYNASRHETHALSVPKSFELDLRIILFQHLPRGF